MLRECHGRAAEATPQRRRRRPSDACRSRLILPERDRCRHEPDPDAADDLGAPPEAGRERVLLPVEGEHQHGRQGSERYRVVQPTRGPAEQDRDGYALATVKALAGKTAAHAVATAAPIEVPTTRLTPFAHVSPS